MVVTWMPPIRTVQEQLSNAMVKPTRMYSRRSLFREGARALGRFLGGAGYLIGVLIIGPTLSLKLRLIWLRHAVGALPAAPSVQA